MILYTNGCSFTWGGGLDNLFRENVQVNDSKRLPLMWPHHLGKLLNSSEVHNLAVGCGSNQRIVRTTYDWLLTKSKEELEQTVAVIQLTEWSRFEMFSPKFPDNVWENHPGDWVNCKIDVVVNDTAYMYERGKSESEVKRLKNEVSRRLSTTTEVDEFYKSISYLYALKGLFLSFGVKDFYLWQQSHDWVLWPKEQLDRLFKDFKILDQAYTMRERDDLGLSDWSYEKISQHDTHPSVEGHKQLADIIYGRMKRLGFKE